MKKAFLFSLGLVVALSSLIVSCSDNNGDDDKNDSLICKISVSSTNGGSAEITNYIGFSANVLIGNGVEVVATPDDGYNFLGWYLGNSDVPVSTDVIFTFTVSKDIALLAKFEKSFSVSVRSAGYGKVSFKDIEETSLNNVLIGTELTVEAVADANCDFIGWFVGNSNEPVSTEATYTFTVNEGVALVAKFNKWPLVSISSGGNGTVSFENSAELFQYVQLGSEVTVVAAPAANCDFLGWFVGNSNEPVSTEATYTFTVKNDLSLVAKFKKVEQAINGHEYVDLGLPSGLKWATCNVGAAYPEDYGGYYAWGEIEEKEYYHWSTYKYCYLDEKRNYSITKYCLESNYGIVDNKRVLDPEDDVAHVKWGGTWRMPTYEDFEELCEICTTKWITQNGVKGRIFTGPNGNSIFLPAAGYNVDEVYLDGGIGYYWSTSLTGGRSLGDYSDNACSLDLTRSNFECDSNSRYWGYSVRPVTE